MNFETNQTAVQDHNPVKNSPPASAGNNGSGGQFQPQEYFQEYGEGPGYQPQENLSSEFPGMELVENYSPHLLKAGKMHSGFESAGEETEALESAYFVSYPEAAGMKPKMIIRDDGAQGIERIIGSDDRVQVRNTQAFPFKAICQLTIRAKNGKSYLGTGWMVSPRVLITAGHNIFLHGDGGGWAQSITVTPGLNGTSAVFGSAQSSEFRSVIGWVNSRNQDADYGAIILPQNAGIRMTGPFFQVAEATPNLLRGKYLNISGYPGDKGGKTQWFHARPVLRLTDRRIFYTIDTMGGHSGSPVYICLPNGNRTAVGIHTYGAATENSGTRFIGPIFQNVTRWKNEAP